MEYKIRRIKSFNQETCVIVDILIKKFYFDNFIWSLIDNW